MLGLCSIIFYEAQNRAKGLILDVCDFPLYDKWNDELLFLFRPLFFGAVAM